MESFSIDIDRREDTNRSSTKQLRKDGKIPAIVYRRGEDSVPAVVAYNSFVQLAKQARISQVFTFKSKDSSFSGRSALVRDIQKDYISGKVIHIDFQALKDDEEVRLTVPLHFIGEAVGVKTEGGVLSIHTHELDVACLPKNIPSYIEFNVTDMKLNSHIHARELPLPTGVKLAGSGDEPLVSVVLMKEEEVATPTATAEAAPADAAAAAPAADAAKDAGKAGKK